MSKISCGDPDDAFMQEFIDNCEEHSFSIGDRIAFLKPPSEHMSVSDAVCVRWLSYKDSDYSDEQDHPDLDIDINLFVNVSRSKYKNIDDTLKTDLSDWFEENKFLKIVKIKEDKATSTSEVLALIVRVSADNYACNVDLFGDVIDSRSQKVFKKYMDMRIKEGVCVSKTAVSQGLHNSLSKDIDEFAQKTPVDYHPNSRNMVRDIAHPALYAYVEGLSASPKKDKFLKKLGVPPKDFFGRDYEGSKYQWLPTPFSISAKGKCTIEEYINNIDQSYISLYDNLAKLFEVFIPYFEEVWSYACAIKLMSSDEIDYDEESSHNLNRKKQSLRGRELQVITKIVDYVIPPTDAYEGVWHVEGMPQEHIVMTGIYFIHRDASLQGGELKFKRAFTVAEAQEMFNNVPQTRPLAFNQINEDGFYPLGTLETDQGLLVVFPNCHVHKLAKLVNTDSKQSATRRIVVFFVVNPNQKIVSTREIPPQQGIVSKSTAENQRLELMAERKFDKDRLNIRAVELCEH